MPAAPWSARLGVFGSFFWRLANRCALVPTFCASAGPGDVPLGFGQSLAIIHLEPAHRLLLFTRRGTLQHHVLKSMRTACRLQRLRDGEQAAGRATLAVQPSGSSSGTPSAMTAASGALQRCPALA